MIRNPLQILNLKSSRMLILPSLPSKLRLKCSSMSIQYLNLTRRMTLTRLKKPWSQTVKIDQKIAHKIWAIQNWKLKHLLKDWPQKKSKRVKWTIWPPCIFWINSEVFLTAKVYPNSTIRAETPFKILVNSVTSKNTRCYSNFNSFEINKISINRCMINLICK